MKYSTFRWNGTTQPLERIDEAVRNHKPPRGISQPLHNGEGMACRRIVTAKHQAVARLLVDGESGYRALRQCGYSHYSARNLGLVLRHSWGLRQAILEEQERRKQYLVPRPARGRRDRFSRRGVAQAVRQFVASDIQAATTNAFLQRLQSETKHAQAIAEGQPSIPERCSVCRGPLEGNDRWCPNCQRGEKSLS